MQPEEINHSKDASSDFPGDTPAGEEALFAPIEALKGKKLDQYLIRSEIGRGSMGVVFEAEDLNSKQTVALKVLPPNISLSDKIIRRFLREAESVAKLDHPNIVKIFGVGHKKSIYYYAMERLEGRPLDQILKEEEYLDYDRVARLMLQACKAIHFAHEHQIIHRDIKPGNLIVSDNEIVTITDFGLARQEKAATLTESGALVGTPIYMSPEQVLARRGGVDKRTDIYSLGVTMYQLLAGKPPFTSESTQEILNQILEAEPAPPQRWRPKIPRALSVITMKAMEKEPEARFQSAEGMAEELRRFLSGIAIRSKPVSLLARIGKRIKKHKIISTLAAATIILAICFSVQYVVSSRAIEKTQSKVEEQEKIQRYNQNVELARELLASPSIGINIFYAHNILGEAVQLCPELPDAHILLAKAYSHQNNRYKAFEHFNLAVDCDPNSSEALLERGLFLLEQGRTTSLEQEQTLQKADIIRLGFSDLQTAVILEQDNPKVPYHMAKTLYECSSAVDLDAEQRNLIITWAFQYAQAAQGRGTSADVECLLAQIHLDFARNVSSELEMRSHLQSARKCLEEALELDNNHNLAYRLSERVQEMIERPELDAVEMDTHEIVQQQGLGNFFTHASGIYNVVRDDIAATLSETKKEELIDGVMRFLFNPDAEKDAQAAEMEAAQREEESLDYLALIEKAEECIEERSDYIKAADYYKRALMLNSSEAANLNYNIASAYFASNDEEHLEKAWLHARLAYTQDSQNGIYLSLLAEVLVKLGDQKGLEELRKEARKNGIQSFMGLDFDILKKKEKKESIPH